MHICIYTHYVFRELENLIACDSIQSNENKTLKETGKTYTTDSNIYQDTVSPFCAKSHIEYEYNGITIDFSRYSILMIQHDVENEYDDFYEYGRKKSVRL